MTRYYQSGVAKGPEDSHTSKDAKNTKEDLQRVTKDAKESLRRIAKDAKNAKGIIIRKSRTKLEVHEGTAPRVAYR
jgi:hypothetical protein